MFLKTLKVLSVAGLLFGGAILLSSQGQMSAKAASTTILISEVSIGSPGLTNRDYVRLYNLSSETYNLKGSRLIKRSKTGTTDTSIKSWTADTFIPANGYYTWANNDYADELQADISTSQTLASDNCLALRLGAADSGEIIDALGWGECTQLAETLPICNPTDGQVIKRTNNQDTDNNSIDFTAGCAGAPEETEATSTPTNNTSGGGSSSTTNTEKIITTVKEKPVTTVKIIISEIRPNPTGEDSTGEYIELFNNDEKDFNLAGHWLTVDDQTPFYFSATTTLKTKAYLLLKRLDTKLKLSNNGGKISVYNNQKNIVASLNYNSAPEGQVFSAATTSPENKSDWVWSLTPTPGKANIIMSPNQTPVIMLDCPDTTLNSKSLWLDASDSYDPENLWLDFKWLLDEKIVCETASCELPISPGKHNLSLTVSDGTLNDEKNCQFSVPENKSKPTTSKTPAASKATTAKAPVKTNVTTLIKTTSKTNTKTPQKNTTIANPATTSKQPEAGSNLSLSGTVLNLPGDTGTQYFFIWPDNGSTIWQIYRYNKNFPKLAVGDRIQASGIVSIINKENRLKLQTDNAITITEHNQKINPEEMMIGDISEDDRGRYITITGQLSGKQGNVLYIDDGSGELAVYNGKVAADNAKYKVGATISASGVLRETSGGWRLLSRADDLAQLPELQNKETVNEMPQVSSSIAIAPRNQEMENRYWLLLVGLLLIIGGWSINPLQRKLQSLKNKKE